MTIDLRRKDVGRRIERFVDVSSSMGDTSIGITYVNVAVDVQWVEWELKGNKPPIVESEAFVFEQS